ncbi:MAG TPA: c-type cytochrome biogenesis protein CcmI [Caulobacter sp.]|nr:c-type cytochrome biogenesis protein CcmI [Caulobacter sp.]
MMLWIVLTLLVALAVAGLVFPLARPRPAVEGATPTGILADQLRELEGQAASGAVTPEDAARLKLEIERRLLAEARADEPAARPLGEKALLRLALGLAAAVALGATGIYALVGRPDLPSQSATPTSGPALPADHPGGGDVGAMLGQLEAQVKTNPRDVEGWRMLGWSYFQTGRFGESAEAYGRAAKLDPTNPDHPSAQGESLVQAAGGQMTPDASAAFRRALALDPGEPRARYFLAVEKDQAGDRDGAMADWIALVNSAPDGAPWAAEVRSFVEDVARERGVDLTGKLKPASGQGGGGPAPRGPTAADIAEAQKMAPDDQQRMIRGMVEGLEGRLKDNPRDADGWVRLMRARMVLNEPAAATRALRSARAAFKDRPAETAKINEAAKGLGVPGG